MDLLNMRLSPSQQKTDDELEILAAMILDDLLEEHWTAERFANACRKHRKTSSFLPTTADLMAADRVLSESALYHSTVALPTWAIPADEHAAKNQARAKDILAALRSGIRPPWATRTH